MQTTNLTFHRRNLRLENKRKLSRQIFSYLAVVTSLVTCTSGRGEVRLDPVGDPLWEVVGTGIFAAPGHITVENTNTLITNTRERLSEILGETHVLSDNPLRYSALPGDAHEGPYDNVWREAVASAGLINTDAFVYNNLRVPNALLMGYTLVPSKDAPLGASPDFTHGPIIPDDILPIRGTKQRRVRNGNFEWEGNFVFPRVVDSLTRVGEFTDEHGKLRDYSGLNWSHAVRQGNFVFRRNKSPSQMLGKFEWTLELRDSTNSGWDITYIFDAVEEATDLLGDFSYNDELDVRDLNILTQNVAAGATNLNLDMNGDEDVDVADIHYWVTDLKSTWIGDTNLDGAFDENDIVSVLQAGKFATDQLTLWSEGDWNGDERFDRADIILALQDGGYGRGERSASTTGGDLDAHAALGVSGSTGDGQTSLVYDASTGQLSVDAPSGQELTSINVTSSAGRFLGNAPAILDGAFDNFAMDNIFKATFGGSFGSISFGNVLPVGIAESDVADDLSVVGSLAGGGDLGNVDLVYVPEPASMLLLIIGFVSGLPLLLRGNR